MSVDYSHQQAAIGLTIAFSIVGTIFVTLRIWSRLMSSHRLFLGELPIADELIIISIL
jgi:hypothetical protein